MTFTLKSANQVVKFDTHQIDAEDRNFGFVWIHKCPVGGWAGNYMSNKYMVSDARRIYAELQEAGYTKA